MEEASQSPLLTELRCKGSDFYLFHQTAAQINPRKTMPHLKKLTKIVIIFHYHRPQSLNYLAKNGSGRGMRRTISRTVLM